MDEAGRSAKPPLMTASVAEDAEPDAVAHLDAEGADEVHDFSGDASAGFSSAGAAGTDDDADSAAATDYGLSDADGTAGNDADGTFSWGSSSWSSSSWDSSSSTDSSADDSAGGFTGGSAESAFGDSSDGSYSASLFSSSASSSASPSASPSASSPGTRAEVPFPADQIGRTRSDTSTLGGASGRENTRAEEALSPTSPRIETGSDAADSDPDRARLRRLLPPRGRRSRRPGTAVRRVATPLSALVGAAATASLRATAASLRATARRRGTVRPRGTVRLPDIARLPGTARRLGTVVPCRAARAMAARRPAPRPWAAAPRRLMRLRRAVRPPVPVRPTPAAGRVRVLRRLPGVAARPSVAGPSGRTPAARRS